MVDRRNALAFAALVPAALAARPASACSIAVERPDTYAARLPEIARLFHAWFDRDELGFLGTLVGPDADNASEDFVRRAIAAAENREPHAMFEKFFTARDNYKQIVTITAVGENGFVAVSEQMPGGIGADCSGMPTLHLFLVKFRHGRPHAIVHVESETWSGYTQAVSLTGPA